MIAKRWGLFSVGVAAALAAGAHAQDAGPPVTPTPKPAPAGASNDIVVTGTRIARPELDFPNPVVTVSADKIERSGRTNLTDLLQQSPALIGSTTGDLTGGSVPDFGEAGLNELNLRNLGTDRTLVLVDGLRHVAGRAGSAAVDIDTIPTDLVAAIDVLTGGASAIYGADGVSGVVNFRLKHDFEGLSLRAQNGISKYGDGANHFVALTYGRNFAGGRGNVAIAYEFNQDGRVPDQNRPYLRNPVAGGLYRNQADIPDDPNVPDYVPYYDVRYADSSPLGAVNVDFRHHLHGEYTGDGDLYDRGMVLKESGGYTVGGDSTKVDGYQGDLFPGVTRHLVNLLAHYDVSDAFSIFTEDKYVHTHTLTVSQPTYDYDLFEGVDNPFMPETIREAAVLKHALNYCSDPANACGPAAGQNGVLVTRDNFDLGVNAEDDTRETLRGVIGARGRVTDHAKYEVALDYGQTKSTILSLDNRITDRWLAAIDVVAGANGQPECRATADHDPNPDLAGCVPFDIFGSHPAGNAAAASWINEDTLSRSKVTQTDVSASLSGDFGALFKLPGGPIGFALGGEYRRETSSFDPAADISANATWQGALEPERGAFDVKEVYGELNAPVLKDKRLVKLLSFGAALRYSDYSTIGSTLTWKVDGVYAPVRDISFRGTYSQAVRAPNIGELFAPAQAAFDYIEDPCDTQFLNNGSAYRQANCTTILTALGVNPKTFSPSSTPQASVYTQGTSAGNPALIQETAKTWTAGIVLRPRFLPRLSLTADWYDIRLINAINTPEAEELADLCVDQPTLDNAFCPNISRNPNNGYINGFSVKPQNVAAFRTAGLDLTVAYRLPTRKLGAFDFSLNANYLNKLSFVASPGAAPISNANLAESAADLLGAAPKYSAVFDMVWKLGKVSVNYTLNWQSRTHRYSYEDVAGDPDYAAEQYLWVKEKWDHDIQVELEVNDHFSFYAGVNNLANQLPAFGYSSYPISALGRFFYAGAKVALEKL